MTTIEIAALIISLAAGFSYAKARVFRLPSAIGRWPWHSFVIVALSTAGFVDPSRVQGFVAKADFANVLVQGMLGLLLFAEALQVDLAHLATHRWSIGALALGGTLPSILIVGFGTHVVMRALEQDIGLTNALLSAP
ncbi:MAG: cation:proton antiporter [Byssovorax sp.]